MRRLLFAVAGVFIASAAHAQSFDLSIKNIMRGPELVGEKPDRVQFTDDARWVYFTWKPGGRPWYEPVASYRAPAMGGAPEKLSDAAADSLGVLLAAGPKSDDARTRVVSYNGDLFILDRRTLAVRRLTNTKANEVNPIFSRDGRSILFLRDNNVYALSLTDGALTQLTDLRNGPAPDEPKTADGQRKFLEEQQKELFEHVRRDVAARDSAELQRKRREAREVKAVYLARDERVGTLTISRNGDYAVLQTARVANPAKQTAIPDWITRSGYTENIDSRSKVGDAQQDIGRIGIVDLKTGDIRWLKLSIKRDSSDAKLAFARVWSWNDAGTALLVSNYSADFKDQWLHVLDPKTGTFTEIAHERNNAWVGGPCDFWSGCAGWLPDNQTVYYASEKDGYSHIYLVGRDGKNERQITKGAWEVYSIAMAPTKDRFYVTSNEGTPAERHFYHMTFAGARTKVTTLPGNHQVTWSNDGTRVAAVHSYANTPWELYVGENKPGTTLSRVTTSPTKEWSSYKWITPPIVEVPARDGTKVPARIYRPNDFGAQPNGAAVIFVHGAGYLQNVHNWWSDYYREYMFHHFLATKGYTVIDVDYRGSQGYGRDWRTAIYRHMGGKDLTDQVDAAAYLVKNEGVDAKRIGIYGGSYGGFITLMALFTEGEHFGAGAALRSVTDWAHYNHGYTGRILNTPQGDTIAYKQSSPIYFAEGLNKPLLMAHGMVDTNVHFSDIVRLSQRLIELGKTNWELAAYPVENHGFVEPTSWTDEYTRIFNLFEKNLR